MIVAKTIQDQLEHASWIRRMFEEGLRLNQLAHRVRDLLSAAVARCLLPAAYCPLFPLCFLYVSSMFPF